MLTQAQNELLTTTGPGTPAGGLLRSYWQPAALSEELPPGGAPLSIQLLGEPLVLFRDESGQPGLLGLHCSHRGTDLSYGRVESGGLRCLYHGWVYDVAGHCLEQPGEPVGSDFYTKIHHPAYPCQEVGGIIFAYMGSGRTPPFPMYEALTVDASHRLAQKFFHECNYLQGNEGNIDPIHTSFLHRQFAESEERGDSGPRLLGVTGSDTSNTELYRLDMAPTIEVEETDFGLRVFAVRRAGPTKNFVRISNFLMVQPACERALRSAYSLAPAGARLEVPFGRDIADATLDWRRR